MSKIILTWRETKDHKYITRFYDLVEVKTGKAYFYIQEADGLYYCACLVRAADILNYNENIKAFRNNRKNHNSIDSAKMHISKIADSFGFKILDENLEIYV
jgi:hypothetical protein